MTDPISLETRAPIANLVLNRPDKRNALSSRMWTAIPDLIRQVAQDQTVKVLVLHGGDSGSFSAGADISEFGSIYATAETAAQSARAITEALEAVANCPKPVIAAIEGACIGGGVSLAMAADLRVAGVGAKFGITPAKLGLVYPPGDTQRLITAIGLGATKDILFTGRIFPAEEAKKMGLIDRLVPAQDALSHARAIAADIAANSQWSTQATKRMIAHVQSGSSTPEADALFLDGFQNEDFKEGYKAFLDKRAPGFTFS